MFEKDDVYICVMMTSTTEIDLFSFPVLQGFSFYTISSF